MESKVCSTIFDGHLMCGGENQLAGIGGGQMNDEYRAGFELFNDGTGCNDIKFLFMPFLGITAQFAVDIIGL